MFWLGMVALKCAQFVVSVCESYATHVGHEALMHRTGRESSNAREQACTRDVLRVPASPWRGSRPADDARGAGTVVPAPLVSYVLPIGFPRALPQGSRKRIGRKVTARRSRDDNRFLPHQGRSLLNQHLCRHWNLGWAWSRSWRRSFRNRRRSFRNRGRSCCDWNGAVGTERDEIRLRTITLQDGDYVFPVTSHGALTAVERGVTLDGGFLATP